MVVMSPPTPMEALRATFGEQLQLDAPMGSSRSSRMCGGADDLLIDESVDALVYAV